MTGANWFNVGSSAVSSLGNIFGGLLSNAVGASTSKKLAKYQAALNFYYGKRNALESPSWNRKGLEDAGYNPMLAVQNSTSGSNSSWATSNPPVEPDFGNLGSDAISNALNVQHTENETNQTNSTVNLQNEQAQTEQSKRENLSFQNAMLDVEKHLKQKDLDNYDERFYTEMYEMMQNAEKLRQEASVVGYNAESSRIIANAQKEQANTQKDYVENHTPSGRSESFNNYMSGIHHGLSGIGELIHGYNETNNYNGSNESETVYYDKNGKVRGSVSHKGKNRGSSNKSRKRR